MAFSQSDTTVAFVSMFSGLLSELNKTGAVDPAKVIANIQATAARRREKGAIDLAETMHAFTEHLLQTVPDGPIDPANL